MNGDALAPNGTNDRLRLAEPGDVDEEIERFHRMLAERLIVQDTTPVEINYGVAVPRAFRANRHVPGLGTADIDIEMVDGEALVRGVRFAEPIAQGDLDGIAWGRLIQGGLIEAGWAMEGMEGTSVKPYSDRDDDRSTEAVHAYDQSRRRGQLTYNQLKQVAALWKKGGPSLVQETFHVSKRTSHRHVARAREEGLL